MKTEHTSFCGSGGTVWRSQAVRTFLPHALATFGLAALWLGGGCGRTPGTHFKPGTYGDDLTCVLRAVDSSGDEMTEGFTAPTTLIIAEDGSFTINGTELAVGQKVIRSIPTAELAFEVTEIIRDAATVTVEYDPRPSLPGITIEGSLVETYRWFAGSVQASALADLIVTDASGKTAIDVSCNGVLSARSEHLKPAEARVYFKHGPSN